MFNGFWDFCLLNRFSGRHHVSYLRIHIPTSFLKAGPWGVHLLFPACPSPFPFPSSYLLALVWLDWMSSMGSEENLSLFIPDEERTVTPLLSPEKLTPYPVTFTHLSLSSVDFSDITLEAKNKHKKMCWVWVHSANWHPRSHGLHHGFSSCSEPPCLPLCNSH